MKSRRISPAVALVGVLLAVGLAGLVLLFISDDDEGGPQHSPLSAVAGRSEDPQAPSFRAAPPEPRAAVPVEVPDVQATPLAGEPQAAQDDGPRRRVTGRVVRLSDGTPLAGITIAALFMGSKEAGDTVTSSDSDGRFEFPGVDPDTQLLTVSSEENGWPERTQKFPLPPGVEPALDLELVFDSGFIVQGEVRDSTGHPAAKAVVDIDENHYESTDEFGRFSARDVAPELGLPSVRVSAVTPGHVRTGVDLLVPDDVTRIQRVQISLPASGAIAGRITDRHGTPLPGVVVLVEWRMTSDHAEEAPTGLQAVSKEGGEYLLDCVAAGRFIVSAGETVDWSLGYPSGMPPSSSTREADVVVQTGKTTRLDFVLFGPSSISGRVRDEFGAPIAGAKLTLHRVQRWPAPDVRGHTVTQGEGVVISSRSNEEGFGETELVETESYATTDERGDYEFTELRAGEKRLSVAPNDHGFVPHARTLHLAPEERLQAVNFTLVRGLVLRGRVTDPSGLPLAGVTVQAKPAGSASFDDSQRLLTGDDGRFELQGLPPGQQQLLLLKTGYATFWEQVQPGTAEQHFVLQRAQVIAGQVTHAVHGQPITRFDITVIRSNTTMSNVGAEYAEGRFEMPVNEDEPCTLIVRAAGFAEVQLENVLPSQTAIVPLRIQLSPLP
ncbi:MAG: carboxypeptidase-like regulatory domain-containing protein [Planctomycetota bacterium]